MKIKTLLNELDNSSQVLHMITIYGDGSGHIKTNSDIELLNFESEQDMNDELDLLWQKLNGIKNKWHL